MKQKKQNCWEVFKCGREPGGHNALTVGACFAATNQQYDGVNHGTNAGRVCWSVVGTLSHSEQPNRHNEKKHNCEECSFIEKVSNEEGTHFNILPWLGTCQQNQQDHCQEPNQDTSYHPIQSIEKCKTLIVDDDPSSVFMLKNMLAEYCECFVATNGHKGIELFENAQKANKPFDVVLLDIIMPGINGIDTLKQIRRLEIAIQDDRDVNLFNTHNVEDSSFKLSRIIMQTSSEEPQDMLSSFMEGKCNGFINKPYSKEEILQKIFGTAEV